MEFSMATKYEYRVSRGKNAGAILTPHRHANGKFVVSKTRFEKDYVYLDKEAEIDSYLELGYKLRMSDPATGSSPSLISRASISVV